MVWTTISPDETKSVSVNTPIMKANSAYINTTMKIDHHWNEAGLSGHHQFAMMPKYTDGIAATPASPTLAAGIDLAYFARLKTAAESAVAPTTEPYARNAGSIMQLLGIKACGVIDMAAGVPTVVYKHNIKAVGGVTYTADGKFKIEFEAAFPMPSINYIILGGAMRKVLAPNHNIFFVPDSALAVGDKKKTTEFSFHTVATDGTLLEPLQVWFVCFGG